MYVYKITNQINQKVYIGITNDLEKRWNHHKKHSDKKVKRYPLYLDMDKYGLDNFSFEIIENDVKSVEKLGELERKYIRLYKSHITQHGYNQTWGGESCQYDGNPRTKLTIDDVITIRELYDSCTIGTRACWKLYKERISYDAFEKIWEGTTWKGIMDYVYTKENKEKHKKFYNEQSSINETGSKNPWAKYDEKEVLEIRKYYVNHSLSETYEKYGKERSTRYGFRSLIDKTYLHIPMYSKVKKKWILNGKEIDINSYNPVSTISVSGE